MRRYKRILISSLVIAVLCLFLFFGTGAMAVNNYNEGPYSEGTDIVEITSDAAFSQNTYTFTRGNPVYIRITTPRVTNASSTNRIRLYNYSGTRVGTIATFTQQPGGPPYVYTGSVTIPATAGTYLYLMAQIRSSLSQRFNAYQMLEITDFLPNQYFRFYKDATYTQEKYAFKSTDTLYGQIYGNAGTPSSANSTMTLNLFNNTTFSYTVPAISVNGNYYSFALPLNGTTYTDQWWYALYTRIRNSGGTQLVRGYKMFVIDDTLPTVSITSPANGATIAGTVNILGTANDTYFDYYKVEYEDTANPGVWNQIGTDHATPVTGGTLETWDTTTVANGTYNLRLTTFDKAENVSTATVTNLNVNNPTGSLSLSNVDVTWSNVSPLSLPNNTGKGLNADVTASGGNWRLSVYTNSGDAQGRLYTADYGGDYYRGAFQWNVNAGQSTSGPTYTTTPTDFLTTEQNVADNGSPGTYTVRVDYALGDPTWDTSAADLTGYSATHYYTLYYGF